MGQNLAYLFPALSVWNFIVGKPLKLTSLASLGPFEKPTIRTSGSAFPRRADLRLSAKFDLCSASASHRTRMNGNDRSSRRCAHAMEASKSQLHCYLW